MIKTFIVACTLLIFSTQQLSASEEKKIALEELQAAADLFEMSWEELMNVEFSSATGTAKPLHTVPAVATVITSADIKRIGATRLDEVLETVPGLHVSHNPTGMISPSWSIRGIKLNVNPHVLMLINGVPFKQAYVGDRNRAFQMLVHKISRIEVIRGPGSAVHGADAFAGVINVITKKGSDVDGSDAGVQAGSFNTYGAWVQHGGIYDGLNVALTLEGWKTDGDPDRIIEQDRMTFISPEFSLTPTELKTWHEQVEATIGIRKDEWTLNLYGTKQKDGTGYGSIALITDESVQMIENYLADLTYHNNDFLDWDLTLRLHYLRMYYDLKLQILPAEFLNQRGHPMNTQNEGGIEATVLYAGVDTHRFRLSVGGQYIDVDTEQYKNWFRPGRPSCNITEPYGPMVDISDTECVYMEDQLRKIWYVSFQDEWAFTQDWEFTAGIRYDHYSDFGDTVNPRLALVWEAGPKVTAKLLYGQAFRAPSLAELYIRDTIVADGNPDLNAEELESLELSFDYRPASNIHTGLNLFTYKATNLVEFVPPIPQVAENHGEQTGRGFELELDWKIHETFDVRTNLAYQHSRDKTLDAPVPNTPELQYYLNPHWKFLPQWSLDGQFYWIGKQQRHPDDPRDDLDDYTTVNLTLRSHSLMKHLDAAIGVRNLFNEDAREPSIYDATAPEGSFVPDDIPIEGRSVWAEVRYRF